jgi:hypothetical protein
VFGAAPYDKERTYHDILGLNRHVLISSPLSIRFGKRAIDTSTEFFGM